MTERKYPQQRMLARFMPSTAKVRESGEIVVDITWSTGAQVRRYDWWEDQEFIEELDMSGADLSRLNAGAPFLRDHRATVDSVIGVIDRAWMEDGEGRATVRFSQREDAAQYAQDVQAGVLRNVSVGYMIREFERIGATDDNKLPIYRATDWLPMEVSLVAIGADAGAQVRSEDAPYSNVTLRGITMTDSVNQPTGQEPESVENVAAVEQRAATQKPEKPQPSQADIAKAERQRIADITAFARKASIAQDVVDELIESGRSFADAKEKMLDIWSGRVDSESSRGHVEAGADESDKRVDAAVTAIMAKAGALPRDERAALQGNPYVGWRMMDFARDCAERAGVKTSGLSQMEIVGRAFTQGTSDFDVILENTMHKSVVAAYAVAADTWRRWCRTGSVSDFRAHKRIRFGTIGSLDGVNELGEFTNKAIPDGESESITASTRGNIINVSRQAVINDDVGYFVGLTQQLGRAAARTIEAQAYSTLVANPTMSDGTALFHADHGNLAGTGAAPTVATIDAGRQAMASQMDISGNDYLDLRPSIALCPLSLGGTFRVINAAEYNPSNSPGSTTGASTMEPNSVRGLLTDIVDSPRLAGNGWYLFADPMEAPVIEVVFLDGNDQPFLEMEEGFTVDGARYKVRLDFGVGAVGYAGAWRNAGA
jgi:hypothetical protein